MRQGGGADPSAEPASIRVNTAFALAMRVGSALFTAALTLFLVRYLGPDDYGVFALALSVGLLLLLPADFGASRSAARFIAERRGKPEEIAGVLRKALLLKLGIGALVSVALIAAADPIADAYDQPDLVWPLRIVALAVLGQSLMLLFTTAFEAVGRNSIAFRLTISESALELTASVGLVLAGAGVAGATGGRAIGYGVGALLGLLMTQRMLGRANLLRAPEALIPGLRQIALYAGALLLVDSAYSAFTQIDILLIGSFLDARSAGIYAAPVQMLAFAAFAGIALAAGVAPRLARTEEGEPDVGALERGLRLLLIFQFLVAVPLVVWATPITDLLLGPDYAESADVFRALGPFIVMVGPGPLLALSVNYLGEARRRIPLALGALGINALIDILLIPEIGIVAGAIGTDVAYLFFFAGHVVICRRLIGLPLSGLARTALRTSLAAAAMAGVLFAFGTSSLTVMEAVAGAVLGLMAYGAVLFGTSEITRSELRAAGAATRRALGGRSQPSG